MFDPVISVLDSTLRGATPLILAALAGLFSERAGVIDISLEGKMLSAAFASAAVAYWTGNPYLGLLAGMLAATLFSLLHACVSVTCHGNQLICGIALNTIASGLTPVLTLAWFAQGGRSPQLPDSARFQELTLPFATLVRDIPVLGPIYSDLLSGHCILIYFTVGLIIASCWLIYASRFGLHLRAVGENPHAADTAGVNVARVRYLALICNGLLLGIAGSFLSVYQTGAFIKEMTAGKGYLALAALIFGKWRPIPVTVACLLFAFADALQIRLEGMVLPIIGTISSQFIQCIPYLLTVFLLAGFVGRAQVPQALGRPFVRGQR